MRIAAPCRSRSMRKLADELDQLNYRAFAAKNGGLRGILSSRSPFPAPPPREDGRPQSKKRAGGTVMKTQFLGSVLAVALLATGCGQSSSSGSGSEPAAGAAPAAQAPATSAGSPAEAPGNSLVPPGASAPAASAPPAATAPPASAAPGASSLAPAAAAPAAAAVPETPPAPPVPQFREVTIPSGTRLS